MNKNHEFKLVKIDDSYLILCERYQKIVDFLKLHNSTPLYISYFIGRRGRPEFHFYDHLWNLIK